MKSIGNVLFPVDLSEVSSKIVPWVHLIAEKFNATVHVLFVARAFEHYAGMGIPLPYIHDFEGELVRQGEKRLLEFVEVWLKDVPIKTKVVSGHPAEQILEYVRTQPIDIIVIGTHSRRGLEKAIFGSVAEHVVKFSPVPVTTVNPYRS